MKAAGLDHEIPCLKVVAKIVVVDLCAPPRGCACPGGQRLRRASLTMEGKTKVGSTFKPRTKPHHGSKRGSLPTLVL